ncbi:hypothetical protein NC239_33835 [Streptomyces sp. G3]|uniref:hypothetical protein n=1 Tax=Streptomyces sp. G3 TaxID=690144 RepID=UPI00202DC23B|nr:hypothetical protein [Streptomyces sp. G3]MCM1943194.1 hypothetical protein [Streptomyces sp. G3]
MNQHYTITAPIPITLRPTANGVDLDVSQWLTRGVLLELFADAAKDPMGFAEEMADLHQLAVSAQHQGRDSHARHEFDARVEKLLDRVADGGRIPVYGTGLGQLRDATAELAAPRPVPSQQQRRAS